MLKHLLKVLDLGFMHHFYSEYIETLERFNAGDACSYSRIAAGNNYVTISTQRATSEHLPGLVRTENERAHSLLLMFEDQGSLRGHHFKQWERNCSELQGNQFLVTLDDSRKKKDDQSQEHHQQLFTSSIGDPRNKTKSEYIGQDHEQRFLQLEDRPAKINQNWQESSRERDVLPGQQYGQGEYPGSPMSPTQPPSIRKRQSMQRIMDLEVRLDQLTAENRSLAEVKILAERHLEELQLEHQKTRNAGQEALHASNEQLHEKEEASRVRAGVGNH